LAINASLTTNLGTDGVDVDSFINIENLVGSAFGDTLTGDGNDNILTGGAGADHLNGGGGIDTASFANASLGVIASLTDSFSMFQTNDAQGDTFTSIENLTGSNYNDTLFGDSNDNVLSGGEGDDILAGLGGDDTMTGGLGNDTIYADDGHDIVDAGVGNDTIHVSTDTNHLPVAIDGGDGVDTMILHGLVDGASFDLSAIANLADHIETLDIRDGVASNLVISGADIRNMVDNLDASQLTIQVDSGDTLTFTPDATELMSPGFTAGIDNTYIVTDGGLQIAQINWDVA